ncbi:MAG: hypothetical protein AAFR96_12325 [Planctomycetota bacterium]
MSSGGDQGGTPAGLEADPRVAMSTGQFAEWLAKQEPGIPASGPAFKSEYIRQLCKDRRMPGAAKQPNGRWAVVDPDAALAWCRAEGVGEGMHGGRRRGEAADDPGESSGASDAEALAVAGGGMSADEFAMMMLQGSEKIDHLSHKQRVLFEQARRLWLENQEKAGSLVPVDRVRERWSAGIAFIRRRLERIAGEHVRQVRAAVPDLAPEVERALRVEFDDVVREATGGIVDDPLDELESEAA